MRVLRAFSADLPEPFKNIILRQVESVVGSASALVQLDGGRERVIVELMRICDQAYRAGMFMGENRDALQVTVPPAQVPSEERAISLEE